MSSPSDTVKCNAGHDTVGPLCWECGNCPDHCRCDQEEKKPEMSINEAFAARRAALVEARQKHYEMNFHSPDFAPYKGFCNQWNIHLPGEPRCNYDLVAHFGDAYPTADITRCPRCSSSYCE